MTASSSGEIPSSKPCRITAGVSPAQGARSRALTRLLSFFKDKAEVLASEVIVLLRLLEKVVVEVRLVQLDVLFASLVRRALLRSRRACLHHHQLDRFAPEEVAARTKVRDVGRDQRRLVNVFDRFGLLLARQTPLDTEIDVRIITDVAQSSVDSEVDASRAGRLFRDGSSCLLRQSVPLSSVLEGQRRVRPVAGGLMESVSVSGSCAGSRHATHAEATASLTTFLSAA